jgi:hypothetical protein
VRRIATRKWRPPDPWAPLLVLTASDHRDLFGPQQAPRVEPIWQELQVELTALSTDVEHRVVPGATHRSLQTTDATVTIEAIGRVVEAVRTRQRLTP